MSELPTLQIRAAMLAALVRKAAEHE